MKVNRTRSITKKAMKRAGNTSNRPEQQLAFDIISRHLQGIDIIEKEYRIDFNNQNWTKIDIYIKISNQKYALYLNGPPHDELKAKRHDRMVFLYLEERDYIPIPLSYNNMPYLFLRNKRELDWIETKMAYKELHRELKPFGLILKKLKNNHHAS